MRQFAQLKIKLACESVKEFWAASRLRQCVVIGAGVVFWLLMLGLFSRAFIFLRQFGELSNIISDYMFAFLFLALLIMMGLSNAIICYTGFYRNDEANFLMALPARVTNIFAYKSIESVLFSAWGVAMLVVPLILGYGLTNDVPWHFYPISFALTIVFMGLPMEIGALTALFVPIVLPRRRKPMLILAGSVAVVIVTGWALTLLGQRPSHVLTETGLKRIMDRIAFCQHWALPSHWVSEGMLASARGNPGRSLFFLLLLLSNVLFIGMVALRLAHSFYQYAWAQAHAMGGEHRKICPDNWVDRVLRFVLSFLPARLRLLVIKDIRSFRRDAAQWSQVLLFFGLLGLYILNLPRMGIAELAPYWHSLVSLLNLGATCLTLATLTSRFVFPQLSLEGRRIWVVGLMPLERRTILWGKFTFAAGGSFLISGALIGLSDVMLGLALWKMAIHLFVVLCACIGLNGLAVGLGAVYPNMHSDNPSEIVSGFGGTLNLLCSIFFIIIAVTLVSVPLHMNAVGGLSESVFTVVLRTCLTMLVLLTLAAALLPMYAGVKSFQHMQF